MGPDRLVLVGSVIVDVLMRVPELPERGGDVLAQGAEAAVGGGFNVLAAARRHGLPAAYAGLTGGGAFGAQVRAALNAEGVRLLLPEPADGDSGFCVGFVEPGGERTFATSPGVESQLDRAALDGVAVGGRDAVYVSGYDLLYPVSGPAIAGWLRTLPAGVLVVLDPGPLVADIPWDVHERVLRRAGLVTLNAREAKLLLGSASPRSAFSALEAYAPRLRGAVLRHGADGCWTYSGGAAPAEAPAPPVDAVDTTGAGDTHTGVLLAGLAAGLDLPAAALRANVAAALSTTRRGGASCPDVAAVDRLLRRWHPV